MSALVTEYSIEILKKINFELGNAIKVACDVGEPRGVGTEDSLRGQEQELLQVGGEMQNTETNLEPGCSEPSLKPASHVETCLGDQGGSRDDVVHGREEVLATLQFLLMRRLLMMWKKKLISNSKLAMDQLKHIQVTTWVMLTMTG